jgi:transcription initiation factor IIE alpha subunit
MIMVKTKKRGARPAKARRAPAKKKTITRVVKTQKAAKPIPKKISPEERKKLAAAEKEKQKKEERQVRKADISAVIERLLGNERVEAYIKQNVSKRASEVIRLLNEPRTDEEIAGLLDIKINTARRVLNILQGYGVTNYTTQKDSKGWLSFFWYINTDKIDQFFDYIKKSNSGSVLSANCNDYFICKNCYDENKLVFNFDSAFETNFKCTCNTAFTRVDREFVKDALNGEAQGAEPSL